MIAAATIVIMAAPKKTHLIIFVCTTRITHTILLMCIWILDFHLNIVLVLCRRYLIPIPYDVTIAKEKFGLDGDCTTLIFTIDDGYYR